MTRRQRARHITAWLEAHNNRAIAEKAAIPEPATPKQAERRRALMAVHIRCVFALNRLDRARLSHAQLDDADASLRLVEADAARLGWGMAP